jgi:hypothetical protein
VELEGRWRLDPPYPCSSSGEFIFLCFKSASVAWLHCLHPSALEPKLSVSVAACAAVLRANLLTIGLRSRWQDFFCVAVKDSGWHKCPQEYHNVPKDVCEMLLQHHVSQTITH